MVVLSTACAWKDKALVSDDSSIDLLYHSARTNDHPDTGETSDPVTMVHPDWHPIRQRYLKLNMVDNFGKSKKSKMAPGRNEQTRPEVDSKPQSGPPAPSRPSSSSQPHPSFIQVAKPYVFEHTIQQCLAANGVDPQREDSIRIQGVTWIDNVRRALHLYVFFFLI
jgi:hypothetical protein